MPVTLILDRAACKLAARSVKSRLTALGHDIPLSAAYEVVAAVVGETEWNILATKVDAPPVTLLLSPVQSVSHLRTSPELLQRALDSAVLEGNADYIEVALSAGAKPNAKHLSNILWRQEEWRSAPPIVRLFLAHGSDIPNEALIKARQDNRRWAQKALARSIDFHQAAKAASIRNGSEEIDDMLLQTLATRGAAPDPVHPFDGQWWFWDEVWSGRVGPHPSEDEARASLHRYGEELFQAPSAGDDAADRCHACGAWQASDGCAECNYEPMTPSKATRQRYQEGADTLLAKFRTERGLPDGADVPSVKWVSWLLETIPVGYGQWEWRFWHAAARQHLETCLGGVDGLRLLDQALSTRRKDDKPVMPS